MAKRIQGQDTTFLAIPISKLHSIRPRKTALMLDSGKVEMDSRFIINSSDRIDCYLINLQSMILFTIIRVLHLAPERILHHYFFAEAVLPVFQTTS